METKETNMTWQIKTRKRLNTVGTFFKDPSNVILIVFGVLLALLAVAPLISVLKDTFLIHDSEFVPDANYDPLPAGSLTLYHWWDLFAGDARVGNFYLPLLHSLEISVLSCAFAILFGGGVAFLITRTNLRFKKFISAVFIFPYIMPQWTLALFWYNMFISTGVTGGHMGEFQAMTGLAAPGWFVYGAFPISLVLGIHYAPFAYILIGGILRNADSNLEEAATILNIPKWKVFWKVTIPMLKPALLSTILLVFSSAMSSYPVPVLLGTPSSYYVLATKMQRMLQGQGGYYLGEGNIISVVLITFGLLFLIFNQISTSGRKQYTTVTGKSGQVSKINLGKVNTWIVSIILCILVLFFCIGPMVSFALESMLPNSGDYSIGLTLRWWNSTEEIRNGYRGLWHTPEIWEALWGSIKLSLVCAFFAGTFGLLIGYAVSKKRKNKGAQIVNGLAFLPYLLPSISMSAVFFTLATKVHFLYANRFLLCAIVGIVKYIPFASRSSLNAMLQLSNEIEEAGVIQNINWGKRMTKIVFPIQKSAFLSGYLLPFISCMRELSLFVFISPTSMILTTLMFQLDETGIPALENGANLILVIVILFFNWVVNKVTGASLDKGIGG
jgi:iron(III) transport system permease protein